MPKLSKKTTQKNSSVVKPSLKERVISVVHPRYAQTKAFVQRKPLTSLAVVFGALLVLLILGKAFEPQTPETTLKESAKAVEVYAIGESPKATFQAKVEKTGVVKVIAQTSGIVQTVSVKEGDSVTQGQAVIKLSSNYQGGSAPTVQRQIAQTHYQQVLDTYDTQRDLIDKQRKVADETEANADKLREIARDSKSDTNSLIDLNNEQLEKMEDQLEDLKSQTGKDAEIAQLEGSITQLKGSIIQLRSSQRSVEYQGNEDNAQAKLATLQKDITKQQLDIQEKSLATSKEVARLQVSLAYINESLMCPASPFSGKVERVYVREGESVSPGTVIASIVSSEVNASAVLQVPSHIASIISSGEPSELLIGDKSVAVTPYYVSSQATDGQLYAAFYDIPQEYQGSLSHGQYVSIRVPVEMTEVAEAAPFVPVDAIYQTQDAASVLVVNKDKAESKEVTLGNVFGSYVEVRSGLTSGDRIILNRNIVAGDKVTAK